jgi:hypothetical protein
VLLLVVLLVPLVPLVLLPLVLLVVVLLLPLVLLLLPLVVLVLPLLLRLPPGMADASHLAWNCVAFLSLKTSPTMPIDASAIASAYSVQTQRPWGLGWVASTMNRV